MAVAFGAATDDAGAVGASSFTFNSTGSDVLVVCQTIDTGGGASVVTGVNYNSSAMTEFGTAAKTATFWVRNWYMYLASGVNTTMTMTTSDSSKVFQMSAAYWTGSLTAPQDITGVTTGTASSVAPSLNPTLDNSFVVLNLRYENQLADPSGTNTQRVNASQNNQGSNILDSTLNPQSVSTTINATGNGSQSFGYTIYAVSPAGPTGDGAFFNLF